MKLQSDLHLEVSRKLQNTVNVKVYASRARQDAQRVCLGTLHMPESYFRSLRRAMEMGLRAIGGRLTVGGSYFAGDMKEARQAS